MHPSKKTYRCQKVGREKNKRRQYRCGGMSLEEDRRGLEESAHSLWLAKADRVCQNNNNNKKKRKKEKQTNKQGFAQQGRLAKLRCSCSALAWHFQPYSHAFHICNLFAEGCLALSRASPCFREVLIEKTANTSGCSSRKPGSSAPLHTCK